MDALVPIPQSKGPDWVISGGAGPSPTRQVKLNKRTLTPRTARLFFVQKSRIMKENQGLAPKQLFLCIKYRHTSVMKYGYARVSTDGQGH